MGGEVVRHEPNSIKTLEKFPEAYEIFREAGWINFFEQLRGSIESVSFEFSRNLNRNLTEVKCLRLDITKEVISIITTL